MDKRIILAVAGAGKTYTICNDLDCDKNNLILAFTRQNIANIRSELVKRYGVVPKRVKVMTFHSFVYRMIVLPYFPSFSKKYDVVNARIDNITLRTPPPASLIKNGYRISNKNYYKVDDLNHYVVNNKIYCSLMTALCNKDKATFKRAIKNIAHFFDMIYIDEFQDFRDEDYKFILYMSKNIENICLVGDYFQHSVSGTNNSGQPFKKSKKVVIYEEYKSLLQKEKFNINDVRLNKSRRCIPNICDFIKNKLNISIESCEINYGDIVWVDKSNVNLILEDENIVKLIEKKADNYKFNCINWGYSKGDTYNQICVILTGNLEEIDKEDFTFSGSDISKNKLYVALTRSCGNVYILKKSVFDLVKDKYTC